MSFASKYRPQSLRQVIGNADAVGVLRGALKKGRIPTAILFHGPSGCGKTTLARAVFNHLRCEKGSACGVCDLCTSQDTSDLVNFNASKERGIDEMRVLIENAKYRPQYAKKRVIILDELHQATSHSQEALLNSLEEPPTDTIFILCTTEPDKIKATLRKRCLTLHVGSPSMEDCQQFLQSIIAAEEVDFPYPEVIQAVYEQAGSSLRECANMLETLFGFIDGKKNKPTEEELLSFLSAAGTSSGVGGSTIDFVKAIYEGDYPSIHKILLNCEDYNALVNSVIWLHSFLVDVYVTKGAKNKNIWWTPANKEIHKWFKEMKNRPSLEQTIIIQTVLIELKSVLGFAGLSDRHIIGARIYRGLREASLFE